jgi:hypothetical protein
LSAASSNRPAAGWTHTQPAAITSARKYLMNRDRCRILDWPGIQCRREPLDPDASLPVCWHHLRQILDALKTRGASVKFNIDAFRKSSS